MTLTSAVNSDPTANGSVTITFTEGEGCVVPAPVVVVVQPTFTG